MRNRMLLMAAFVALTLPAYPVDKGKAKFMGGTLTGIKEKTDGAIDLKGDAALNWVGEKGARIEILWPSITELEYGQKVGFRWRSAILFSPLALFSKARKHFVTISFKDKDDKEQAAVFEFDKDEIRMAMASMKARTGKDFIFQDEQAKKQMGGGEKEKK